MVEEPDQEIHKKEIVGRRAFGKDKDIFSTSDGVRHYKIDVFTDKRSDGLSVDRLGIGEVLAKRVRYLDPLGVAMGQKRGKVFRGWAAVSVTSIHDLVKSTAADGETNVLHAEIMRGDEFPTTRQKRAFAYELCDLARKLEFVESPSYEPEAA